MLEWVGLVGVLCVFGFGFGLGLRDGWVVVEGRRGGKGKED